MTAAATPANQQPDAVVPQVDVTDAVVSSAVIQLAAMYDCPIQMLQQSPNYPQGASLDAWLIRELVAAADEKLERKCINGVGPLNTSALGDLHTTTPGPGSDLLGLISVTGIGTSTYTQGSRGLSTFIPQLGSLGATVSNARFKRPGAWIMRCDCWLWLNSRLDTTNQHPFGPPYAYVPPGVDEEVNAVGSWAGIPIHTSEGVPVSGGQDIVLAVVPSDWCIFESPMVSAVFEDVLSGTGAVRIMARRYCAFLGGRYPSGTAVMSGTGLSCLRRASKGAERD